MTFHPDMSTRIGALELKNPLIAASAEHLISQGGIRAAVDAGAGAVVVKSVNESEPAKAQLRAAQYVALDGQWNKVEWGPDADPASSILTRSGLSPYDFDEWLERTVADDKIARTSDCLLVANVILADIDNAVAMAKQIQSAGLRALEFNIGTPYASEAVKGAVATETSVDRVASLTRTMCDALDIPVWIKLTGQAEDVPGLAAAALDNGAQSVVMAGRLLGMLPDLETQAPMIETSGGYGGGWNLPLTCHWLALSRDKLGSEPNLIGINGATSGHDIARMMLAGASAVGMASAIMLRGFGVISESLNELEAYCQSKNMNAADLIGRAADVRKTFPEMPELADEWKSYLPPECK